MNPYIVDLVIKYTPNLIAPDYTESPASDFLNSDEDTIEPVRLPLVSFKVIYLDKF